ncbi:MAG: glycosyltransferase family 4 protein, partial [Peptococcaceae bacterium]|nr:glycosyltransferase family 4 protein [Peptococcaceae bacterium]
MKKVLLIATVQSHIAQFHKPLINVLHENGYEVHVAARDNLSEKNGLVLDTADKTFNVNFSRSPYSFNNIVVYKQIKHIISENNYQFIHCNTPMGGVVGRLAARKARKSGTKVIYTAHGFHFFKGAPLINWLVYYPIEKILSGFTDVLITIM